MLSVGGPRLKSAQNFTFLLFSFFYIFTFYYEFCYYILIKYILNFILLIFL